MGKQLPGVLIISRSAWRDDNNAGNTLTNLLSNWPKSQIANLYCRNENPSNDICSKYFRITDNDVLRSILKHKDAGMGYELNGNSVEAKQSSYYLNGERAVYGFFRNHRFVVFLALREAIWKLGKWRNGSLVKFLNDLSPDVIFFPVYDSFYMHDILEFCKRNTKAKVVLFFADDTCSFRQFSLSPLYWLNRMLFRAKVRKSISISDLRYGASKDLCEEYSKIFKCDFEPLYKGAYFDNYIKKTNVNKPIRIIYAGNLFYGRWKTLRMLVEELKRINDKSKTFELHIYTHNKLSGKMKRALGVEGTSFVMKGVSYSELKERLSESDIVLHVESFSLKQKLVTRLSFSTKIIDCFQSARCILAIGPGDISSIKYLKESNAALVVDRKEDIAKTLKSIEEKPDVIIDYSQRAFLFGKENHSIDKVREKIERDFVELADNSHRQ